MQCYKTSVSDKRKPKHQTELQFLLSTTLNACVKQGNVDSTLKPIPETLFHLISQGRCFLILMSDGLLVLARCCPLAKSEPNPVPTANTWSPTRSRIVEQIVWYVSRERVRERPLPVMGPCEAVLVMDLQLSCPS